MSNDELPFELMRWIKAQREEQEAHEAKMALKNAKDDELYIKMMVELFTKLGLTTKERVIVLNLLKAKNESKNLSPAQRSMIAGMYYKKVV